jgi:hypothetical protein
MKQIEIYGQRGTLYSPDKGRTGSQSAIDRCLWAKKTDVALGITKEGLNA